MSVALSTMCVTPAVAQQPAESINGIRMSSTGDRTRVWLELSDPVEYKVFQLNDPPRLVVDFPTLNWDVDRQNLVTNDGYVRAIRFGQLSPQISRLVLDLSESVNSSHGMFLAPFVGADHRLVMELIGSTPVVATASAVLVSDSTGARTRNSADSQNTQASVAGAEELSPNLSLNLGVSSAPNGVIDLGDGQLLPIPRPRPEQAPPPTNLTSGKPVIVIDAGHGGKDPGASGGSGLVEKQVTLAIARKLRDALVATGQFDVVMTRDSDKFIPLRDRPKIGRENNGSLFISLHADSAANANLRGASVYTLSETASDRESAALAERENGAGEDVDGLEIGEYPEDIRTILVDLAIRRTLNESNRFAEMLVDDLRDNWRVLPRKPHRFAGFAVLSSADMPSVLVEMGYLTNSNDVRMLGSDTERARFVRSMVKTVTRYFDTLGGSS